MQSRVWIKTELFAALYAQDGQTQRKKEEENKVYATGGRVLNFVSISDDLKKSRESVIHEIEKLNWENGFYRRDIGFRIIDK